MNTNTEKNRVKFIYSQSFLSIAAHWTLFLSLYLFMTILEIFMIKEYRIAPARHLDSLIIYFIITIVVAYFCMRSLYCFVKYRKISSNYDVYSMSELAKISNTTEKKVDNALSILLVFTWFNTVETSNLVKFTNQDKAKSKKECQKQSNHLDKLNDGLDNQQGLLNNDSISETTVCKESVSNELEDLLELLDEDEITDEEFLAAKDKLYER